MSRVILYSKSFFESKPKSLQFAFKINLERRKSSVLFKYLSQKYALTLGIKILILKDLGI